MRLVGTNSTVDVFSSDAAAVVLNGMNYSPRPIFQSYAVYTRALAIANAEHFDANPPDYVLLHVSPVDGHFAPCEDSLAFLRILTGYSPVLAESPFILMKKKPDYHPSVEKLEVESGTFKAGELIPMLPVDAARFQWLEVDCKGALADKLKTVLYADNYIRVHIERMEQQTTEMLAPRACLKTGFLLNPLVLQTSDLLPSQSHAAARLSFSEGGHYRLYTLGAPNGMLSTSN
jgi:hypothetical protein